MVISLLDLLWVDVCSYFPYYVLLCLGFQLSSALTSLLSTSWEFSVLSAPSDCNLLCNGLKNFCPNVLCIGLATSALSLCQKEVVERLLMWWDLGCLSFGDENCEAMGEMDIARKTAI